MSLPRMIEIRQRISAPKIDDLVAAIRLELRSAGLSKKIRPGMRIAIAAGSRGISHYCKALATVVEEVKKVGGGPFIFPAMGSHGGATPEGQVRVLEEAGVTAESVGAPICASMEVDEVGKLEDGVPVYVDRIALKSDGIIIVNRVKPHTDFKGEIESGLMKMIAIGLGKQKGAEMIHRYQAEGYHKNVPQAARLILKKAPIIFGLALVENAYHEIAMVKALKPEEIEREEMKLLEKAKALLARIPFKELDVLIIEEIGKEISGAGMDTNVTGRFWIPGEYDPQAPKIKRIVVLDLSEQTHGNAIGLGFADLTTKKAVDKIDFHSTFVNCLTSCQPEAGKTPVFLPNDRDAILTALRISGPVDPQKAKVVRVKNTLELDRIWISESLYDMVKKDKELFKNIEITGEPREMQFDVLGMLAR